LNCTSNSAGQPCQNQNNNRGDFWNGPIKPGNILACFGGGNTEYMLVLSRLSATQLSVTRGYGYTADPSRLAPKAWSSSTNCQVRSVLVPNNPEYIVGGVVWNFLDDPTGTDPSAWKVQANSGGGHQSVKEDYTISSPEPYLYTTPGGIENSPAIQYL